MTLTIPTPDASTAMKQAVIHGGAHDGATLHDLSLRTPVLVVFLRHLGCTFCREAVSDIAAKRTGIEKDGTTIVLIHMSPPDVAAAFFATYGLTDIAHISDPSSTLYRSFGLRRGNLWKLFGPSTAWRGIKATLAGHRVGRLQGDGFQMPGVFLIQDGRIIREFRHSHAGERPDYTELAACPVPRP